jgi:hypothetical protein
MIPVNVLLALIGATRLRTAPGKPIRLPKTDLPRSETKSYNPPIGSRAEKEVIQ